jgi:hypothetical protein
VPTAAAEFVIMAVFYYVIYELRLVQLKLECGSIMDFERKHRRTRCGFLLVVCVLSCNLLLESLAYALRTDNFDVLWTVEFNIKLSSIIVSCVTDITLMGLLWVYLIYFFKKKKQMLRRQRKQFESKEKWVIIWLFLVIASNTVNICMDNMVDMVFHFIDMWTEFEMYWKIFTYFWFDLLVLTNGLTMLFLYRHMAILTLQQESELLSLENDSQLLYASSYSKGMGLREL